MLLVILECIVCAAPEILTNSRHYDGASADVWSAGVMLFVRTFRAQIEQLLPILTMCVQTEQCTFCAVFMFLCFEMINSRYSSKIKCFWWG